MQSRFDPKAQAAYRERYGPRFGNDLADRVFTSQLLGQEPGLVLHGGGNTSVKTQAREIDESPVEVLYIKGSGWDLGAIEPQGFPACRLDPLLRYCELSSLSDEQMVRALRGQMLDPASPTPSVEALLHAFVPGKFVDHTHADAVLSVVDTEDSSARAREIWGDGLLFVPYVMPGFALAQKLFSLRERLSSTSVLILDKHGIFTWGETAEEAYERMIAAVTRAEQYLAERTRPPAPVSSGDDEPTRRRKQHAVGLAVRGALARHAEGFATLGSWRQDPAIRSLLEHPNASALTRIGTATPDHVIRTKPFPAWLPREVTELDGDSLQRAVARQIDEFVSDYHRYFAEHSTRRPGLTRLDPLPRLLLAPGLGLLSVARSLKEARIAGDIYARTAGVIAAADALGGFQPVGAADLFDVEYWSLEQAKLKLAKNGGGPLASAIAVITGAASGIGLATARALLKDGAHVVVSDRDGQRLATIHGELTRSFGERIQAFTADVTDAEQVEALFDATLASFGGLDVVISNAGNAPTGALHEPNGQAALEASLELNLLSHQRVAGVATRILIAQGTGGCLLFNASKSAFNPGPGFGPYAVPKAALIALMKQYAVDLGDQRIRTGAVNADRIRTNLFSPKLLAERAQARGVSVDEYFQANLLRRETTAEDVAEAFRYLATAKATTGAVLTVDGGNPAAFPR